VAGAAADLDLAGAVAMLNAGEIETGVNLLTGDLMEDDDMMDEEDEESSG